MMDDDAHVYLVPNLMRHGKRIIATDGAWHVFEGACDMHHKIFIPKKCTIIKSKFC